MTHFKRFPLGCITALALLAACQDEALSPPPVSDALFTRYAAMGNSITAGFQSGGINDSTQRLSYAVMLAEAMGHTIGRDFTYPSIAMPGCPPPLANVFTKETVDTVALGCAFRDGSVRQLNNVAIPGAATIDLLTNLNGANPNPLTSLFLGGRTQLEATALLDPTFVTVWIGNNDVLGAVLDTINPGSGDLIVRVREFQANYDSIMATLDSMTTIQGGVLIGVVQVVLAPYATAGASYWQEAQTIPDLTVDANCLATTEVPGTTDTVGVLVPFHYGAPIMDDVLNGTPRTLDCSVDQVISPDEAAFMTLTVGAYNAIIEEHAEARDWVYIDPNDLLGDLVTDPTKIRPFPAFDPADPDHLTAPFGSALSLDGFHPSTEAQILMVNTLVDAINARYGTRLSGR